MGSSWNGWRKQDPATMADSFSIQWDHQGVFESVGQPAVDRWNSTPMMGDSIWRENRNPTSATSWPATTGVASTTQCSSSWPSQCGKNPRLSHRTVLLGAVQQRCQKLLQRIVISVPLHINKDQLGRSKYLWANTYIASGSSNRMTSSWCSSHKVIMEIDTF